MEQARVAVCHAFGWSYKKQVSELLPYGIYTIPEVSAVGVGEEDALVRGHEFDRGAWALSATTRAARSSATKTAS